MELPEDVLGVTVPVPSVIKHGLIFWKFSRVQPAFGNSSLATVTVSTTTEDNIQAEGRRACHRHILERHRSLGSSSKTYKDHSKSNASFAVMFFLDLNSIRIRNAQSSKDSQLYNYCTYISQNSIFKMADVPDKHKIEQEQSIMLSFWK